MCLLRMLVVKDDVLDEDSLEVFFFNEKYLYIDQVSFLP